MDWAAIDANLRELITLPSAGMVWLGFAIMVFAYAIVSLIMNYHWRTYGFDHPRIVLTARLYFIVSGLVIAGMLAFLIVYQAW